MLNASLLDPKTIKINKLKIENARLKEAIRAFKEYDEERKDYYRNLEVKIGKLNAYIEELEDGTTMKRLVSSNEALRKELCILQHKSYLSKVNNLSNAEIVTHSTNLQLKEQLGKRDKIIRSLRDTVLELVCKLNKAEKIISELQH